MGEEGLRGPLVRLPARREDDIRLGDGETQRVGGGDDGRLGDGLVLQQGALQLEGTDLVVGGLEDVVGPADVREVPVRVPGADVAGAVVAAYHHLGRLLRVAVVTGHQAHGVGGQVEADLALLHVRLTADRVDEGDAETGARAPHGPLLEPLTGAVGDLDGGLRLAEAVPDGDAPGAPHRLDDLRVEGFAYGDDPRGGVFRRLRSDWISIRHTVGGAQKLVTPWRSISSSSRAGSKRV